MINPHNTPKRQAVDALLDELIPEGGAGSPKDLLDIAITDAIIEAQDLAVIHHGQQILSVIEGRGYAGRGSIPDYNEDIGLGQAATRLEELDEPGVLHADHAPRLVEEAPTPGVERQVLDLQHLRNWPGWRAGRAPL